MLSRTTSDLTFYSRVETSYVHALQHFILMRKPFSCIYIFSACFVLLCLTSSMINATVFPRFFLLSASCPHWLGSGKGKPQCYSWVQSTYRFFRVTYFVVRVSVSAWADTCNRIEWFRRILAQGIRISRIFYAMHFILSCLLRHYVKTTFYHIFLFDTFSDCDLNI